MKKALFTLLSFLFIFAAKAQKIDTARKVTDNDTTIYAAAEQSAEYPGGINGFYRYLAMSIRYPLNARTHRLSGRVIVRMIIEKDGSVCHVQVLRKVSADIDAEAIRVVSGSPKWHPGIQNGKPVRMSYVIPISFNLQ